MRWWAGLYFPIASYVRSGGLMRFLSTLIAALFLLVPITWADEGHHHTLGEQEIVSVRFSTSYSPRLRMSSITP